MSSEPSERARLWVETNIRGLNTDPLHGAQEMRAFDAGVLAAMREARRFFQTKTMDWYEDWLDRRIREAES